MTPVYCPDDPSAGFVAGTIGYFDCQTISISERGWASFAAGGSTLSLLLTALFTVFVALLGYRMLFGDAPDARKLVNSVAKIGIILALAGSWPAYRTLVHDPMLRAPAEFAAELGGGRAAANGARDLPARLQHVDDQFRKLETGQETGDTTAPRTASAPSGAAPVAPGNEPHAGQAIAFAPFALGTARIIFELGAIGALAALRVATGLLLAVGPFFIALLLFDATRGLFSGWLRTLFGAALASFGVTIVLEIELALLGRRLAAANAAQASGEGFAGLPSQLLTTVLLFALILLVVAIACGQVARAFRLPEGLRQMSSQFGAIAARITQALPAHTPAAQAVPAEARSRAAAVADSVAAARRREEQYDRSTPARAHVAPAHQQDALDYRARTERGADPRRTNMRRSAGASRRDMTR